MFNRFFSRNKPSKNQALEKIASSNDATLIRAETFRASKQSQEEKFAEFLNLKHQYPYMGFVPCRAGNIDFTMFHANDDIVAWEYFWFGADSYETEIINTWLEWCKGPNVVLDIGAYTGLMSILAARLHPKTTVELFEPMDRTIERAKINLKANHIYQQVNMHNKAASNHSGPASINMPRDENFLGTGNAIDDKGGKIVDVKQIQCVQIDEALPDIIPTVVKIDVEGHELACLEGMEKILSHSRPKMIIEVWENTRTEVLNKLDIMDYDYVSFEENERRVMNFRCEPKK